MEYTQKANAIMERSVRILFGIPMYSLNVRKIANKKNAVIKAPTPSIRKSLLVFKVNESSSFRTVILFKILKTLGWIVSNQERSIILSVRA